MKNKIFLPVLLAGCMVLTGCGGNAIISNVATGTTATKSASLTSTASYDEADTGETYISPGAGASEDSAAISETVSEESKKIYTGSVNLETTDFDFAYDSIQQTVSANGGWFESDTTGTSGVNELSYASMEIRVPVDQFDALISGLTGIEDTVVKSKNINTEDVSETYYDTEGRLENAKKKLEKLQDLADEADNVQDMITIEESISDVEYDIEYYQGILNGYDSKISYSTIDVELQEVSVLSMTNRAAGYGNKLVESLKSGFSTGVDTIGNLILFVARNWLVLAVLAAVLTGLKKILKKKKYKKEERRPKVTTTSMSENDAKPTMYIGNADSKNIVKSTDKTEDSQENKK